VRLSFAPEAPLQGGAAVGSGEGAHPNAWHSTTAAGPASWAPPLGLGTLSSALSSVEMTTEERATLPYITLGSTGEAVGARAGGHGPACTALGAAPEGRTLGGAERWSAAPLTWNPG
jgi:hypothetical protein